MKNTVTGTTALLLSAQTLAGNAPSAPVPMVSELSLLGISVILVGLAARLIAKRVKKS